MVYAYSTISRTGISYQNSKMEQQRVNFSGGQSLSVQYSEKLKKVSPKALAISDLTRKKNGISQSLILFRMKQQWKQLGEDEDSDTQYVNEQQIKFLDEQKKGRSWLWAKDKSLKDLFLEIMKNSLFKTSNKVQLSWNLKCSKTRSLENSSEYSETKEFWRYQVAMIQLKSEQIILGCLLCPLTT